MDRNQRDEYHLENRANRFGGYAQGNSGGGSYRGSKGRNTGRPRGSKAGNSRGGGGKSSFASPEMIRPVLLIAAIPVLAVLFVVGYFTAAALGA